MKPGEYRIWKITHNGVDTHLIHFHLFEVQLINGDGFIRLPDANELAGRHPYSYDQHSLDCLKMFPRRTGSGKIYRPF